MWTWNKYFLLTVKDNLFPHGCVLLLIWHSLLKPCLTNVHNFLTHIHKLWWVGSKFKTSSDVQKENRSEHGGREKQDRVWETDTAGTVKDRQAEEKDREVEKKTPNVILHSLHGVQGRREIQTDKKRYRGGKWVNETGQKEKGMGEGREGREKRVTLEKV